MWWSDRRRLLTGALSLSALSACGFTPLYGEGTAASRLRGQIDIPQLPTAFGFAVRERLLNRLGAPENARFRLSLELRITEEERAIRADRTITRFNLNGTGKYTLIPLSGGDPVESGAVEAFTAYSAVASPFATRTAEEDARARLATTLADNIVQRRALSADRWLP